nr:hypothetical protein [Deltaproteobacteria bacterium]
MTVHWEEIVYLAALTHDQAIVAWGKFPVRLDGDRAEVMDQNDPDVPEDRQLMGFVGHESPSWGPSRVTILQGDHPLGSVETTANFTVIRDLTPDTDYRCEVRSVEADGSTTLRAASPRRLEYTAEGLVLLPSGEPTPVAFRTFPLPTAATPDFRFFVIGDSGTGVDQRPGSGAAQASVAKAMAAAMARPGPPVRFV